MHDRRASGFLIENEKITTPVDKITIARNLKTMFKNLMASNDLNDRAYRSRLVCRIKYFQTGGIWESSF